MTLPKWLSTKVAHSMLVGLVTGALQAASELLNSASHSGQIAVKALIVGVLSAGASRMLGALLASMSDQ